MIPIVQIGFIQIPTFFLVICLNLFILLSILSYRVEKFKKNRQITFDVAILLMLTSFIGARLFHVFYEEWGYYAKNPNQIIQFWNGGFVFYGGVLLSFIVGLIYARLKKISFREWADFLTPLFSLGHSLGRVGCILSGCCYGTYCELPWSISGRHPTALYLAVGELLIFAVLLLLEKKWSKKAAGSLFMTWLILHGLMRFLVEYYRDDFRGVFLNIPLLGSLSISQMISLVIVLVSTIYLSNKKK